MDMVAPMVLKDDDGASGDPPLSRLTRYHGILGLRGCLKHRLGKSTLGWVEGKSSPRQDGLPFSLHNTEWHHVAYRSPRWSWDDSLDVDTWTAMSNPVEKGAILGSEAVQHIVKRSRWIVLINGLSPLSRRQEM